MKKIISIFVFSVLVFSCMQAQVEIKGSYKGSQLYIRAQRMPGGGQDRIERLEYAPLTKLEQQVASLQKQVETLKKEQNATKAENERLKRGQKSDNKTVSDSLLRVQQRLVQKERQLNDMRMEIENLKKELQKMQTINDSTIAALENQIEGLTLRTHQTKQVKQGQNSSFFSFGMELGTARFQNEYLKDNKWWRPVQLGVQQLQATYTYYPMEDLPIAIKTGIGFSMYHSKASYYSEGQMDTISQQEDIDGDLYDLIYTYQGVTEEVRLNYLEVPLLLHMGNSYGSQGVQAWCDLGLRFSLKVGKPRFYGSGTYSKSGYYEQWHVTISDVDELGFSSGSVEGINMQVKGAPFVVWGEVAAGVRIPLGDDRFSLGLGGSCRYSLTPVANNVPEVEGDRRCFLPEQPTMLSGKTRIFTLGLNVSFSYQF